MCALQYLYSCIHTSESHSGAHHQYSIHTAAYTCFHTGVQAMLHRATMIQHIVSVGNHERDGQRPDGKQPISMAANDVLRREKWRMAETLKMEWLILCFSKQISECRAPPRGGMFTCARKSQGPFNLNMQQLKMEFIVSFQPN